MNIDCNNCIHINLTEKMQSDRNESHRCLKYNVRIFHNVYKSYKGMHETRIFPCIKCKLDNYKQYDMHVK